MSLPASNKTDNDDSGDLMSLDFTSFVPAPAEPFPVPPAAVEAAKPVPVETAPQPVPPPTVPPPAKAVTAVPTPAPLPPAPPAPPVIQAVQPPPAAPVAIPTSPLVASPAVQTPTVDAPAAEPEAATPALKSASLAGTLNVRVRDPLAQILAATAKMAIRLDLSRIVDADDAGAQLLAKALIAARRAGRQLHLSGAGQLAALLAGRIVPGERTHEAFWLLLAELQLWLGRQDEFEETAIGYAVAFEVSPPSWETPPAGQCEN